MKINFNSKYIIVLRWIVFLPLSIIIAMLATYMILLIQGFDLSNIKNLGRVYAPCLFFFIWNWSIYIIVPNHKVRVSFICSSLWSSLYFLNGLERLLNDRSFSLSIIISSIAMAFITIKYIKNGKFFNE